MIGVSLAVSAFLVGLLWAIVAMAALVGVVVIGGGIALVVAAVLARRAWRRLQR